MKHCATKSQNESTFAALLIHAPVIYNLVAQCFVRPNHKISQVHLLHSLQIVPVMLWFSGTKQHATKS